MSKRMLAGTGELVLLDGADHLLAPAGGEILERLLEHLPAVFTAAATDDASRRDDDQPPDGTSSTS